MKRANFTVSFHGSPCRLPKGGAVVSEPQPAAALREDGRREAAERGRLLTDSADWDRVRGGGEGRTILFSLKVSALV